MARSRIRNGGVVAGAGLLATCMCSTAAIGIAGDLPAGIGVSIDLYTGVVVTAGVLIVSGLARGFAAARRPATAAVDSRERVAGTPALEAARG